MSETESAVAVPNVVDDPFVAGLRALPTLFGGTSSEAPNDSAPAE